MNKKLAVQTKELMLEISDWVVNPNRKLALEVIGEISEQVLCDMNEYLRVEEQREKEETARRESFDWCSVCDHHLSKCRCVSDEVVEKLISDDCSHCCPPGQETTKE